ncbi:protein NRT1/ PTR FAMILY 2.10-like [Momordica charantia]|uniref:Protein NRT1/ PTR FAMILY 2.10-like n=1 Tax=Momordica charantia TaxID=3673 RepID=A0A6J1C2X1_MOMCH|nr:protein NRT1/ PTR FAMILY 2.10-like [Momordica charantia]
MERSEDGHSLDEPKVNYRGVKAMPFVVGNETFEKLGTTGTSSNLLVYLTDIFHMKSITATTLMNIFHGSTNFSTLFGAFLCDTYLGRYKTLGYASVASFMGMVVVTLTATFENFHPPYCGKDSPDPCLEATPWQMAFLIFGLGLLVIGAGGIRPCNLAFGADQFNPNTASGKLGINSFFNWYYFTFTFAMMISLTVIVYVQTELSWAWGLAIPAFLMFLSCALFFMGSWIYVKLEPDGSPFTSVMRVLMAALKKRRLALPDQKWPSLFNHIPSNSINSSLPHTDQFRFLDKAAMITPEDKLKSDGSAADPWTLCSIQQVEEVKCLVRVIPIWASAIIYHVATTQQQTYVVFQALQSDRRLGATHFKIPAASYTIFTMIGLTIWIPFYDRILVPSLRRITGKEAGITLLQKMGFGILIAILTMFVSAMVEQKRRNLALAAPLCEQAGRRGAISSMSALWLLPQLTLIGLSEAFTVIAQVEFYYKEFPESMRSVGGSFSFVGLALSNYLSGFMVTVVHHLSTGNWLPEDLNQGRLDYFYFLVSALEVLNLGYFILCSKWYKYKGSGNNTTSLVEIIHFGKTEFEKTVVY